MKEPMSNDTKLSTSLDLGGRQNKFRVRGIELRNLQIPRVPQKMGRIFFLKAQVNDGPVLKKALSIAGGRAAGKRGGESQNQRLPVTEKEKDGLAAIRTVIFGSLTRGMLGSTTANQCPGELFMPALSLNTFILQRLPDFKANGWTQWAAADSGRKTTAR